MLPSEPACGRLADQRNRRWFFHPPPPIRRCGGSSSIIWQARRKIDLAEAGERAVFAPLWARSKVDENRFLPFTAGALRNPRTGRRPPPRPRPHISGQGPPRHPVQRAYRRGRPDRLRPRLQDGTRRHRVEAQDLDVPLRPFARLAQVQELCAIKKLEVEHRRGHWHAVQAIEGLAK
jgi:hypothetical protein